MRDHPRIRGEHLDRSVWAVRAAGSSPHTRGAPCPHVRSPPAYRIIPAYAGSTRPWRPCRHRLGDHPRIRGEHRSRRPASDRRAGSSPHTRGALVGVDRQGGGRRIIPAYAGSTGFSPSTSGAAADHPRIRGEHRLDIPWPQAMQGSSPHTRGARSKKHSPATSSRIIPAYAGSTPSPSPPVDTALDHPRIRGEH